MTTYLLKWTTGLLVLLLLYKGLVAAQPLHRLKRTYLLAALLIPLIAPLLTVEWPAPAVTQLGPELAPPPLRPLLTTQLVPGQLVTSVVTDSPWLWLYGLYGLGTLLMLVRFARNLYQLIDRVHRHPTQPFRGSTLVLLPDDVVPHTFLNYLFVSKAAFEQGQIRPELLTHELAHIRQRHSLDVLLVELVNCFGWFNPLLFWLRRAMQFNHECLADEAVVRTGGNVQAYQHLLLDALTRTTALPALVSTLTFQTTKQRLLMMTKHASPARTRLAGIIVAFAFGTVTLLTTLTASKPVPSPVVQHGDSLIKETAGPDLTRLPQRPPATDRQIAEVERWFGQYMLAVPDNSTPVKCVRRKYADLTHEEKRFVVCLLPEPPKAISPVQFNDYKNAKKYQVEVDGQSVQNFAATKLTADDIAFYQESYYDESLNIPTLVSLYTRAGYKAYKKVKEANPLVFVKVIKW